MEDARVGTYLLFPCSISFTLDAQVFGEGIGNTESIIPIYNLNFHLCSLDQRIALFVVSNPNTFKIRGMFRVKDILDI